MSKKNHIFLSQLLIFCLFCSVVGIDAYAQIAEDALLFTPLPPVGTARIQGLAGTGYALGGDVTSAYLNPAGLGFANRSSVVFSPTLNNMGVNTSYEGNSRNTMGNRGNIANFGIVFNNSKDDLIPPDWRGGSFAITFNNVHNVNYNYSYGPSNNLPYSIIDDFVSQSNGVNVGEIEDNLDQNPPSIVGYPEAAYNNYLINAVPGSNTEYVASIFPEVTSNQQGQVSEETRLSQWNLAYGGNYKDKLYLGVGIGLTTFNYSRRNTYQESFNYPQDYIDNNDTYFPVDDQLSIQFVDNLRLDETLNISGGGFNANFGAIYRPVKELTVGLTYQTPTIYSLQNEEYFDLASNVRNIQFSDNEAPFNSENALSRGNIYTTNYTLRTPSRLGLGLAYFFEKYGFVTADLEYQNYQSTRFSSNDFQTNDLNLDVDNLFRSVINYRLGGEFRYNIFRARLGYAMSQNPMNSGNFNQDDYGYNLSQANRDQRTISGGIGIALPTFFADLSVANTQFDSDFTPYLGTIYYLRENNLTRASLTLGFNF